MRHWLALSAVALLASGCQILSYTWVTPASVAPGTVFTMELIGTTDSSPGPVGVVFQVPNGFTVLGASVTSSPSPAGPIVRDAPSLLALYTADPGHHLASFSGTVLGSAPSVIPVSCRVYVQAPPTPGTYQLEMALAGGGASLAPQLGLGSFQAPGGSVVRQLQVVASPAPPPFALADVLAFDVPGATDFEAADLDRDGRADLLMTANGVTLRRSIAGGFGPDVPLPGATGALDSAVADFDGDGFADVALSTGTVLFGDGGATWTPVVASGAGGLAVGAGDVDGDGLADVVWSDLWVVAVVRGQANRTFVPWSAGLPVSGTSAQLRGVTVADLDADGRAEIVVRTSLSNSTRVYCSTAAGTWSLVGSLPQAGPVVAIDVDGDGTRELLTGNTGQLVAYSPQGLTLLGPSGVTFGSAVARDFDRDGHVDVATAGSPGVVLWRNVGGAFQAVSMPPASGFVGWVGASQIGSGDFDDDTFPDLFALVDTTLLAWHDTYRGVAPFGEACAAPASPAPDLTVQGSIAPGQSGALRLANAPPLGNTLLWLGNSRTLWGGQPVLPLDLGVFGASGCTLLAEPIVIVGVAANGSGVAAVPFTVPLFAPVAEVTLFAQGAALAPGANALGAVFSRGVALKIQ